MGCGQSYPNKQIIVESHENDQQQNTPYNAQQNVKQQYPPQQQQENPKKKEKEKESFYKICCKHILKILYQINLIVKPPDCLQQCKSKLVHMQGLLGDYDEKKFNKAGVNENFFEQLNIKLNDYKQYITQNLKNTEGVKQKTGEFLLKIQPDMEQILSVNIKDDQTDHFLDELKAKYKGKPGYKTWKSMFKNKVQMPKDIFVAEYASHNDVAITNTQVIANYIDSDKNNVISFEEFMSFIENYQAYYDEKCNVIRDLDLLMQRIQVETEARNKKTLVNNRKIQYPDDMIYEGDIQNSLKHGKGKLYRGNEYLYEGDFCNDAKHGNGTEIKNQTKYVGEWKNNQKFGKGTITYADGSQYQGEFKNDLCEGQGKLILNNKTQYEGNFQDNVMIKGVITYPNGERYEGQTKDNGVKHGHGKLFDATGKLLSEGNFQEDKPTQKYKYQYYEDKAILDKQAADITDLELSLEVPEGHDSRLLANTRSLKILNITVTDYEKVHQNKELTIQLLKNIHTDSMKSLKELHIILPNDKEQNVDKQDFLDLFQQLPKFINITYLDLQLKCWGVSNLNINRTVIDTLVSTFQSFKNLTHLNLDLFSWGYLNFNLTHNDVVKLLQGLEYFQSQLVLLSLNLGRWGCETYDSYKIMTDATLQSLGELFQLQVNLEELNLNIRSWPFKNKNITNQGIQKFFDLVSKLSKLKKVDFNFRGMAYENEINQETLVCLANAVSKLVNLENLQINLQICDNFTDLEPLESAIKSLPKMSNFTLIV